MGFLIGLLTAFMVLDCLVLVLLVLMQLPKKEAGAGLAFGAGATDALFGAGSGNFLTKATKYAAIIFFSFAIILSLMENHRANQPGSQFRRALEKQETQAAGTTQEPGGAATAAPAGPPPVTAPGTTNFNLIEFPKETTPAPATTPAATPTNPAAPPPK